MTVVAIVPAKDRANSVAATVRALRSIAGVDRLVVVDDGSVDDTTAVARSAGAEVLRLPENRGKGGAVLAGVEATPEADIYLLIDADLAATAGLAEVLLTPVMAGEADMTVGVLPPAGARGGFGRVRALARRGIRRACGLDTRAPLSGQRAVRADLLRGLLSAERFGLEVALTVDAVRSGARVVEIDVAMDHRHTGRRASGFAHRGRQGLDISRALWPRLTTSRLRIGLIGLALLLGLTATYAGAKLSTPTSAAADRQADQVVLFGIPRLGLDDLGSGAMPTLDGLVEESALAASSVRTLRSRPSTTEAYATISAGTRVRGVESGDSAFGFDAEVEGSTAREVARRRTGQASLGEVIVVGGAAQIRGGGEDVSSEAGALGSALARAGRSTAVVGNADVLDDRGVRAVHRPAAVAAMDTATSVDVGAVGEDLLLSDPVAPFGLRTDPDRFDAEAQRAMAEADFVVLDPGETDRAAAYTAQSSIAQEERLRRQALRWTDERLASVIADLPSETLLLVVGMTPPGRDWELTPVVAYGAGVTPGHLHSLSTKRPDLTTITDISTTVLDALGVPEPDGMIGQPLRYRTGAVQVNELKRTNDIAAGREGIYYPMALTFIVVQALVYLIVILALTVTGVPARLGRILRVVVLTFAAWPVATFLYRIVPFLMTIGSIAHLLMWLLALVIALIANRASGHQLAPLARIAGLTVAVLVVDIATGANLQMASVLGYSPHTAARFTGFGNTAFAVLAATALVCAAVHVDRSSRRQEAVVGAGALLALVVVADGAPWLGSDVGGILSLVPVFGLTLFVLSGRRVSWRAVVLAGVATLVILTLAIGIDLLRPPESQTHLARFVVDSSGDGGTFWTTVSRKWATNVGVFQKSIWTWMVPIIAVFAVYVLVIAKGWRRLLPPGSPLRAGVVGCIAAGVLGWLVNDSGVVVTALIFVFLGPYLTLMAFAARREPAELLGPTGTGDAEDRPPADLSMAAAGSATGAVGRDR